MQHVNDDMDDLYKNAAENYPLQIGTPDWDKVYEVLKEADKPKLIRTSNNRKYLWLLCLLPLGFLCNRYTTIGGGGYDTPSSKSESSNTDDNKAIATPIQKSSLQTSFNITADKVAANKYNQVISSSTTINSKSKYGATDFFSNRKMSGKKGEASKGDLLSASSVVTNQLFSARFNSPDFAGGEEQELTLSIEPLATSLPTEAIELKTLSAQRNNVSSSSKPVATQANKNKHLYAGLLGGIDLTTVHLQKSGNPGVHYGALVGYNFGKRWSIEAGIFLDKKFYSTQGKYFNTSKIYLPSNTKITGVSGDCKMLEFPINVKFDFAPAHKSTWFVAGGVSSYIVKKEDYSYVYYYGSSGTSAVHKMSYQNSSSNLFSVAQLSGGYTRSVSNKTAVRIEPYIKLPLSGMGFGQLRLTSAGVNAGITRKF